MKRTLNFLKAKSEKDINDIFNYNINSFVEGQSSTWTESSLKEMLRNGWELYSVANGDHQVAALIVKEGKNSLLTEHTPIKLEYQGNGFSHQIKDYLEEEAIERGKNQVLNYCEKNNFRGIGLNESHGYSKFQLEGIDSNERSLIDIRSENWEIWEKSLGKN